MRGNISHSPEDVALAFLNNLVFWSSPRHSERVTSPPQPVPRPAGSLDYFQTPHTEAELAGLRRSVEHGSPYQSAAWAEGTTAQLGLGSSLDGPVRLRQASIRRTPEERAVP